MPPVGGITAQPAAPAVIPVVVPQAVPPPAAAPAAVLPPSPAPAGAAAPAPVEAEPAEPPQQEPAPADAPPADGRAVGIEELPQSLRAALGKFAVTGHVWSEETGLRLLTVNDRIVREGQEAAPGVRLEEIAPNGAIFTLRGWRFHVGL